MWQEIYPLSVQIENPLEEARVRCEEKAKPICRRHSWEGEMIYELFQCLTLDLTV